MIALSINLNKIALIRNSRDTEHPDVLEHARLCIEAGADGITVHPRPDQRHIRADDVEALSGKLDVEFNIEGNPFAPACKSDRKGVSDYPGFLALVERARPQQCTLVPDTDAQLTSDHGFDLRAQGDALAPIISKLQEIRCRVSLFMDPDVEQIKLAQQVGADRIELYTGPYADACARDPAAARNAFKPFLAAAECANACGLGVNAGHDLNLDNLPLFATMPGLLEVSIGHFFTIDCIHYGLQEAMTRYKQALA